MANFWIRFKPKFSKASWVMLIGFLLLFFLDFYSTISAGEYLQHVEANPLFPIIGLWGIGFLNLLAIYLLLLAYSKPRPFGRYATISAFVYVSVIRVIVIINNFKMVKYLREEAPPIEIYASIPQEAKTLQYANSVIYTLFFMLFYGFIVYAIFRLDHEVTIKNEKTKDKGTN